ncbi:hypothetical protein TIFTF001_021258 [Ficus carica]|uniref:Response regulatory domain-containing protein n=1 Tax=Ficus carica TaxID=3494 RepID=A0AA88AGC5_FICCA|nr:hypothetical protein TIFTF001_021258 [Ficus carica]
MSESKNLLEKIPSPEINGYQSDQFPIGMQVLAIDANIVCLTYLVTLLRKCQYQVTVTTKAAEALEILRTKKKFDIVLTDVVKLDIDGFKLLEIISHEMGSPVVCECL